MSHKLLLIWRCSKTRISLPFNSNHRLWSLHRNGSVSISRAVVTNWRHMFVLHHVKAVMIPIRRTNVPALHKDKRRACVALPYIVRTFFTRVQQHFPLPFWPTLMALCNVLQPPLRCLSTKALVGHFSDLYGGLALLLLLLVVVVFFLHTNPHSKFILKFQSPKQLTS